MSAKHQHLDDEKHKSLSKSSPEYIIKSLIAGGVAGCFAKTVVAPLDRVKILFQASNPDYLRYSGSFTGVFRAGSVIYQKHGIRGLYQGHSVTLIRIFPYAAIKFMAYEQFKTLLTPTKDLETPLRRLAAGSLSGLASIFLTYPLDVLRVRMAYDVDNAPHIIKSFKTLWREKPAYPLPPFLGGISNIYRGFLPTVYGIIPYAGFSFLTYETLKGFFKTKPWAVARSHKSHTSSTDENAPAHRTRLTTPVSLFIGGLSGAVAQTVSYPLEIIRRHMQVAGTLRPLPPKQQNLMTQTHGVDPTVYRSTLSTAKAIWQKRGFRGFFVGLSIGYIKVTPMVATSFWMYEISKQFLGID